MLEQIYLRSIRVTSNTPPSVFLLVFFSKWTGSRLQDGINIAKMVPAEYRTFVAIYMLTELIEDLHNRNSLDDERNGILVCIAEKLNAISASIDDKDLG